MATGSPPHIDPLGAYTDFQPAPYHQRHSPLPLHPRSNFTLAAIILPSLAVVCASALIACALAIVCQRYGHKYSFDDQPA